MEPVSQQKNFTGLLSKVYHTKMIHFTAFSSFFPIFAPRQSPNFYHSSKTLISLFLSSQISDKLPLF